MNYSIAMWCTSHSQMADYIGGMSDEFARIVCEEASLSPEDDPCFAALLAKMVASSLLWVQSARVQRDGEGTYIQYLSVSLVDYMQPCMHGCAAGHPVCRLGQRLTREANYLMSIIPDPWPLQPTEEDCSNMQMFHSLGNVYLQHIGQLVRERY